MKHTWDKVQEAMLGFTEALLSPSDITTAIPWAAITVNHGNMFTDTSQEVGKVSALILTSQMSPQLIAWLWFMWMDRA